MSQRKPARVMAPAISPEHREDQLTSLALDLAERQLKEGTASSQVITHFLKSSSKRETLEREKLKNENLLLSAKAEQIASAKRTDEMYENALKAMRQYSGQTVEEDEYDDY